MTNEDVLEQVKSIGLHIRIARLRRGWGIRKLAAQMKVNKCTVEAIEAGSSKTGIEYYFQALSCLGILGQISEGSAPKNDREGSRQEVMKMLRRRHPLR